MNPLTPWNPMNIKYKWNRNMAYFPLETTRTAKAKALFSLLKSLISIPEMTIKNCK